MKLFDLITHLESIEEIRFVLPSGELVPLHFHVTEVGQVDKNFIDCGGTIRHESIISFQLFTAQDYDHRLSVSKLKQIINLSVDQLNLKDLEIEVDYQSDTIGKYGLEFDGSIFQLTSKQTDCLAKDKCGIPTQKPKIRLSTLKMNSASVCEPGTGCC